MKMAAILKSKMATLKEVSCSFLDVIFVFLVPNTGIIVATILTFYVTQKRYGTL